MTRLASIRRAILTTRGAAECLAICVLLIVAATLIRWGLAEAIPHLTFVTYFPAVLIATLMTGWRWGTATTIASALLAQELFTSERLSPPFTVGLASVGAFLFSAAVILVTANALRHSVRELEKANESAEFLNQELQHRVSNTLTVVQAIAAQTLRHSGPQGFYDAFGGRLRALAKAHKMMGARRESRCDLAALIHEACAPFCNQTNLSISGPDCRLPSESCAPLMLCLHELSTNAMKHGALSLPGGRITVNWTIDPAGRVTISWAEIGGPPVSKPKRVGLGSGLLRKQPGIAEVDLVFAPGGLEARIPVVGGEKV